MSTLSLSGVIIHTGDEHKAACPEVTIENPIISSYLSVHPIGRTLDPRGILIPCYAVYWEQHVICYAHKSPFWLRKTQLVHIEQLAINLFKLTITDSDNIISRAWVRLDDNEQPTIYLYQPQLLRETTVYAKVAIFKSSYPNIKIESVYYNRHGVVLFAWDCTCPPHYALPTENSLLQELSFVPYDAPVGCKSPETHTCFLFTEHQTMVDREQTEEKGEIVRIGEETASLLTLTRDEDEGGPAEPSIDDFLYGSDSESTTQQTEEREAVPTESTPNPKYIPFFCLPQSIAQKYLNQPHLPPD